MSGFYENINDALPDIKKVKKIKKELISKGVKYIYSNWIDFLGTPKTKPMPISDFENLYMQTLRNNLAKPHKSATPTNKY